MIVIFRIVVLCGLLLGLLCTQARPDPYEDILKDVESDEDYMSLLNQLDTIAREPVNLLQADTEELGRLPWVSPWLAREIVALRRRGGLATVDDLEKIEGVDRRLVEMLRPFVVVVPQAKSVVPMEVSLRTRLVASPVTDSYREVKTYARVYARYSNYDAGFLVEKDRGEKHLNDLQTAYAGLRFHRGKVIVGDFLMASGHGLVFSTPYGLSPSTIEPWRFGQGDFGIEPYTAVDENFCLHGAAVQYGGEQTSVCVAISRSRMDANLADDGRVTSLGTTGIHTSSDEGEDALREDLAGAAFRTRTGRIRLGLDVSVARYNRDFAPSRLDWLGKAWKSAGSCDVSYLGESTVAFVQGALGQGGGGALLGGFGYDRRTLELLVLGRYYDERFLCLHARPFAFYSGLAAGERGLLTRLSFRPVGDLRVSVGNDLHERRPDDGVDGPSGSESFVDVEIPAGDFTFTIGEKLLATEEPPSHEADPTQERTRLRSRLDIRYDPRGSLEVRMRYENERYTEDEGRLHETSSSDLLRLDLAGGIGRRATVKAGVQVFSIGSYGARIYQYEPGVPYYPAIEMLKSNGSRWYSVLSFDMSPFGKLAAKYAVTDYDSGENRSQFMCYYSLRMRR